MQFIGGAQSFARYVRKAIQKEFDTNPPSAVEDYVFTQGQAVSMWTVNHNLGRVPVAVVYDAGGNVIEAQIVNVSENQLRIYFAVEQTGYVRCV